jgi:outer membrane protein OmpA-like peptidoglycan-associated protein
VNARRLKPKTKSVSPLPPASKEAGGIPVKAERLLFLLWFALSLAVSPGPAFGEENPVGNPISKEAQELITREQFIDMLRIRAPESDYPEKRLRAMDTEEDKPARVTVNILFKVGSTELAGDFSVRQMQEAGEALSSDDLAGYRFEIAGHTDDTGTREDNLKLSQERAQAVKDFLVKFYGIDPDRLVARGYGESVPVASNLTEEGRARNRRVVFTRIDEYK